MQPRRVLIVGFILLEVAAALIVLVFPSLLAPPETQTDGSNPSITSLTSTPTSTVAIGALLERALPSSVVSPSPTPPNNSPGPAPAGLPRPGPSGTPSSLAVSSSTSGPSSSPSSTITDTATHQASFVIANTDGQGVNLRQSPSTKSAIQRTIPEGAVVVATGPSVSAEGAIWYPVRDAKGASGYVQAQYLAAAPA